MELVDQIEKAKIPSSFVSKRLKLLSDTGNGEAKLHLGSIKQETEFDNFFENYNTTNVYHFDKKNLIIYLYSMKMEYIYQKINRYKDVDSSYWNSKIQELQSKEDSDFYIYLGKFTDKSRYYIRAEEKMFKYFFREVCLPLITNLNIEKYKKQDNTYEYIFKLLINENYDEFDRTPDIEVQHNMFDNIPKNRIVYGAPGTGKSHYLKIESEQLFNKDNIFRVTFHKQYSYNQFVGSYKPTPIYYKPNVSNGTWYDTNGKLRNELMCPYIDYSIVEGPFLRILIKSLKNPNENYLLIIEEINRANISSVFGDVFQLLDRTDTGESEYGIYFNKDIMNYLIKENVIQEGQTVKIPKNLFIWSTMNSTDQGVERMDTAFKRRWSFEYISIDAKEDKIQGRKINLPFLKNIGEGWSEAVPVNERMIEWNSFRKLINRKLSINNISEDKLIGPFFMSEYELLDENNIKNKLLLYLRDDVLRHNPSILFKGDNYNFFNLIKDFESRNIFTIEDEEFEKLMEPINTKYSLPIAEDEDNEG